MTDAEAILIADRIDLWILDGSDRGPMRTLRAAIALAIKAGPTARLYRPGGFGDQSVWIEQDQVLRLHVLLQAQAAA